jgi:hypothetical protein
MRRANTPRSCAASTERGSRCRSGSADVCNWAGDGGRPSGAVLQEMALNHRILRRLRRERTLLKCRNCRRHRNRGLILSLGRVWEIPVYCPGGVRRVGGVSLVRASARNAGNLSFRKCPRCSCGARGRASSGEEPRGVEYRLRSTGADRLVVAVIPGKAGGACEHERGRRVGVRWRALLEAVLYE